MHLCYDEAMQSHAVERVSSYISLNNTTKFILFS